MFKYIKYFTNWTLHYNAWLLVSWRSATGTAFASSYFGGRAISARSTASGPFTPIRPGICSTLKCSIKIKPKWMHFLNDIPQKNFVISMVGKMVDLGN